MTQRLRIARKPKPDLTMRRSIKPYQQGELDYLCGIYATINAIRLLREDFAPMNDEESAKLLAEGALFLNDDLHRALTSGMTLPVHHSLTRHLAKIASTDTFTIKVERAGLPRSASIGAVFDWIDASLSAGKPALIFFENEPDHYTVVAGSTASSLLLFDSNGMSSVRKAKCGVGHGSRHIALKSLLRITVKHRT